MFWWPVGLAVLALVALGRRLPQAMLPVAAGGIAALALGALADWVAKTDWVDFLAADPASRSNTSVCLKVVDKRVTALADDAQADFAKKLAAVLEKEGVALDIGGYRDAPAGLRIWCGATVDTADIEALGPWLDWAYATVKAG